MSTEKCRRQRCELPAAENGYFCRNDWRVVPLETKHLLLAYPPDTVNETNESARNQALHRALAELRAELHDYPTPEEEEEATRPQPNPKVDAELVKLGINPEESRNPTEERAAKRVAARKPVSKAAGGRGSAR